MATHGVTIDKLTGGVRPVDTKSGAAIGLLAYCSELTAGDIVVLRTAADVEAADDGTGSLVPIMNAIRLNSSAPVVVVAIAEADLADGAGDAATYTNGFRLLQAKSETGVEPAILCQANVRLIEADLLAIGAKLGATVYLDEPATNTDAAALAAAVTHASTRAAMCGPAFEDADGETIGLSVLYAAAASVVNFWESVSNIVVLGVSALKRPISYSPGDATSQAQLLNDGKVSTIIQDDGYRLWGGLTTGADAQFKFLCVTRTDDVVARSVQIAHKWAVDRGLTATFVTDVVETVKAFLRDLRARGAIINGDAWPDKELNSATSVAGGNLYLDYDFSPVYPAFNITFRRHITNKYLNEIFN